MIVIMIWSDDVVDINDNDYHLVSIIGNGQYEYLIIIIVRYESDNDYCHCCIVITK